MEDQEDNFDDDKINTEGLSDEEIAALEDDDDEKDVIDELADDDIDDDPEKESAAAEKIADTKTEAEEALGKEEATVDASTIDEAAPEFLPVMRVETIEDFEARDADFEKRLEEADEQLESGDIELKDYTKLVRDISAEQQELRSTKLLADMQQKQNEDMAKQRWDWEQEQFITDDNNKMYVGNTVLLGALNAKVIELARAPENSSKSGSWVLKQADKEVRKAFGVNADSPQKTVDKQTRKPDLTNIPKTLASIPAADNTETGDNEFAYLDKLEGMDYERAVAQIDRDPAKAERFVRA